MYINTIRIGFGLLAGILATESARACACGCGVFDVGTISMFPTGVGMDVYLSYDSQNQNHNWSGTSSAPVLDNDDRKITTRSYTLGLQAMFNSNWGTQREVPYVDRTFDSANNAASLQWSQFGDVRIRGIYTGISKDLSSGLTFGLKLPTGSFKHTEALGDIDRDTQIGTGSTDLLVGAFHHGRLSADTRWNWFVQAQLDVPAFSRDEYRPGLEGDATAGVYYDGFALGPVRISPVLQAVGSVRGRDSGLASSHADTGYQRVLVSPGVEFSFDRVKIHADVELPVYQHVNGNQLVSRYLLKAGVTCMF
jgi:hypothetical protein